MSPSQRRPLPSITTRLAVGALTLLALGACGGPDDTDSGDAGTRPGFPAVTDSSTVDTSADTTPSPAPTAPSTPARPSVPSAPEAPASSDPEPEPELIVYAGGEAVAPVIVSDLDVGRLRGAPTDFKKFIGQAANELGAKSTCTDGAVGITVDVVRTDGFAAGAVNDCGGYRALWAKDQGDWLLVQGTQEAWDCALLELYRVPSEILLESQTCVDVNGDGKERAYRQA